MTIDTSLLIILVTILVALFGVAFGYGILTQKVRSNRLDIQEEKKNYKAIDNKLDDLSERTSRVEAVLNIIARNGKSPGGS